LTKGGGEYALAFEGEFPLFCEYVFTAENESIRAWLVLKNRFVWRRKRGVFFFFDI